jgi:hypothetical protein
VENEKDEQITKPRAVEPALVFSELFEGLQIMIDSDQKKAVCHTSMLKVPLRSPLLNPLSRGEGPSLRPLGS